MPVRRHMLTTSDVVTLAIAGRLDFSAHEVFRRACEQGRRDANLKYVIDLGGTEHIHDSGLGLLLMLYKHAGGNHSDIRIVNCPPELRDVLMERELVDKFKIADA